MNKQPVVLILLNTLKFSSYQAQNFSMVAIYLNNIHLSQTAAGDFDQYLTEMIHTFQGSVKALTTQKGLFQWQLSNFDNNHNWASYFHTSSANFDKIPRSQQWWNDVTFFFFYNCIAVLSHWDFYHGKFGLLSFEKASCDRVVLPNLWCTLGVFSVCIIHQSLTQTTGSLMCTQMLMRAMAHWGVQTP